MSREVPEWIGATDDTPIPKRVMLRVFERDGGVCHITGRKILPGDRWQADHVLALINGGENRESNIAPALVEAHKAKTAQDVAIKSKTARVKAKHLGIAKSKSPLPFGRGSKLKRKIGGQVVPRE